MKPARPEPNDAAATPQSAPASGGKRQWCGDHLIVDLPVEAEPFDVQGCFGRPAPTELEIGIGKGGFILESARAAPERNFLGIEWANKIVRYAADRMVRWGVENVRLMRTDARHFVLARLPAESLAVIHIYHPDPWPKKRHHKRRLFQPDFVEAVRRSLERGGRLNVQTDHAAYFEVIHELVSRQTGLEIENELSTDGAGTNFEIKYRREGRSIYRLEAQRVS